MKTLLAAVATILLLPIFARCAEPAEPLPLWPNAAPGEKGNLPAEADITKPAEGLVAGQRVMRIGNISQPTLTIFSPPKDTANGAAVLVCPGGGSSILAWDLEGMKSARG